MAPLWVIIRTEDVDPNPEYDPDDPTVCGIYVSREEAIEEILKLYIEDDIYLVTEDEDIVNQTNPNDSSQELKDDINDNTKNTKSIEEIYDYRPTTESVKKQRELLMDKNECNTYTNRGNLYTLVECMLGAKHEFGEDVLNMYQQSL